MCARGKDILLLLQLSCTHHRGSSCRPFEPGEEAEGLLPILSSQTDLAVPGRVPYILPRASKCITAVPYSRVMCGAGGMGGYSSQAAAKSALSYYMVCRV